VVDMGALRGQDGAASTTGAGAAREQGMVAAVMASDTVASVDVLGRLAFQ